MNSHSKREVLEIFNMNEENSIACFFFLKPATNLSIISDFEKYHLTH